MDKMIGTIKALSLKRKSEGSLGFMLKEKDGTWFNVLAEEKVLDGLLETVLGKGNSIGFDLDMGVPKNFILKEKAKESEGGMDDLTTFEELLEDAHTKFEDRFSITTELINHDWEKQRALFKATIKVYADEALTEKYSLGDLAVENNEPVRLVIATFEGHGDADQTNCGDLVKKHYIRMAETRAIARALRWTTNNAKAAAEETEQGELSEEQMQEELAEQHEEQQAQP